MRVVWSAGEAFDVAGDLGLEGLAAADLVAQFESAGVYRGEVNWLAPLVYLTAGPVMYLASPITDSVSAVVYGITQIGSSLMTTVVSGSYPGLYIVGLLLMGGLVSVVAGLLKRSKGGSRGR